MGGTQIFLDGGAGFDGGSASQWDMVPPMLGSSVMYYWEKCKSKNNLTNSLDQAEQNEQTKNHKVELPSILKYPCCPQVLHSDQASVTSCHRCGADNQGSPAKKDLVNFSRKCATIKTFDSKKFDLFFHYSFFLF